MITIIAATIYEVAMVTPSASIIDVAIYYMT